MPMIPWFFPPQKTGEDLGPRNSWCSESSQATWSFVGRWALGASKEDFGWNIFFDPQELEVEWWNKDDESILQMDGEKTTKYRSCERDHSGAGGVIDIISNVARQAIFFQGLVAHSCGIKMICCYLSLPKSSPNAPPKRVGRIEGYHLWPEPVSHPYELMNNSVQLWLPTWVKPANTNLEPSTC